MVWLSRQTYPEDLRARVLVAVYGGGVAPLFDVSVSYIYKAHARLRLTGDAAAMPETGYAGRKLECHLDAMIAHVSERPDTTLAELVKWSKAERGIGARAAVDRMVNVDLSTPISAKCDLEAQSGGDTLARDNPLKLHDRLCSVWPKPDRQAPVPIN